MIKDERKKYDIDLTDEEISKMSKYKFKSLVNRKVNDYAFNYLKEKAKKHKKSSKILEIVEKELILKRQPYLKENIFHKTECQLLFKLRSRMLDVKTNFSSYYEKNMTCRICKLQDTVESEQHLLECEILRNEVKLDSEVNFEFVFGNLKKQKTALTAFKSVLRKREILLKLQENLKII